MEELKITSTYGGRKIRIEGQDTLTDGVKPFAKPIEQDCITLGEAAAIEKLNPGMIVIFKDCVSSEIELDKEMIGVKQKIKCRLSEGVTFQKENGSYAILAVLWIEDNLKFRGRFARANSKETIKYIVNKALSNLGSILLLEEFTKLGSSNYLITDYFFDTVAPSYERRIIFDGVPEELCLRYVGGTCSSEFGFIPNGSEVHFAGIAVCIDSQNIQCTIKKNSVCRETCLYSYNHNPWENHIEIRGILE